MSKVAVCTSTKSSGVLVSSFATFHLECYTFPTRYIEICAYAGEWRGYDWSCYARTEKTVRVVPVETLAVWAICVGCGEPFKGK